MDVWVSLQCSSTRPTSPFRNISRQVNVWYFSTASPPMMHWMALYCVGGGIDNGACIQWLRFFFFFCKCLLRKYRGVLHQAKAWAKEWERSLLIASVNHASRSTLLSRDTVGRVRCFFVTNHKSLGLIRRDLCSECWVSDLIPWNRL